MKETEKLVNLLEDDNDTHIVIIGDDLDDVPWSLIIGGACFIFAIILGISGETFDSIPAFITPILFIGSFVLIAFGIKTMISQKKEKEALNKLASLIVSSDLRQIDDIVRLSGMPEHKVIDRLRILVSSSSSLKLGNDARYLKGAKINLQTMEITLSDKYIEKEPWTCVYCRSVNEKEALVCTSCQAPKKKI